MSYSTMGILVLAVLLTFCVLWYQRRRRGRLTARQPDSEPVEQSRAVPQSQKTSTAPKSVDRTASEDQQDEEWARQQLAAGSQGG